MSNTVNDALLPEGLRDELPPTAAREARVISVFEDTFESFGYQRVKPPLIEFEETMLAGTGHGLTAQAFRVMDPLSQRMMAIRPDITPQIARIARTRLAHKPRPLRLCYTGQVLRVKGDGLRPERQFAQAGLELIGAEDPSADLEVLCAAVAALQSTGLSGLTVDLTSPNLVPAVCADYGLSAEQIATARHVVDRKDLSQLDPNWPTELVSKLSALISCMGPFDRAAAQLDAIELPASAAAIRETLKHLALEFRNTHPEIGLTLDPGEYHGFEYQTGLGFTLFAKGVRGELGRGGRYVIQGTETAVGVSLYLDTVVRALPDPLARVRILAPVSLDRQTHERLRSEGYAVIWALGADVTQESARQQNCEKMWVDGHMVSITKESERDG